MVALDGPAGTGKSTVARDVARTLGWRYVDTGASYRAATIAVLRRGADPADPAAVLAAVRDAQIMLSTDPDRPGVTLDGADVTAAVRGPDVTAAVSAVSAVPAVRELMVQLQRAAIGTAGAVAEGRDVGSTVSPDAGVKVYLDARPEVRAARRAADTDAGVAGPAGRQLQGQVQADLLRRDGLDTTRAASPLRMADGAVRLDTSDLTRPEVAAAVIALVEQAGLAPGR